MKTFNHIKILALIVVMIATLLGISNLIFAESPGMQISETDGLLDIRNIPLEPQPHWQMFIGEVGDVVTVEIESFSDDYQPTLKIYNSDWEEASVFTVLSANQVQSFSFEVRELDLYTIALEVDDASLEQFELSITYLVGDGSTDSGRQCSHLLHR